MSWLGQFQWARRFGEQGNQLILRGDLQLANKPLLPLEKFAIGGAATVRENHPHDIMISKEAPNYQGGSAIENF